MEEIQTGVWHWSTLHEGIGQPVHSYFVVTGNEGVLIDPRIPDEGLAWFDEHTPPTQALLTNRHHYRHAGRFRERFGTTVWCNENGMHEFEGMEEAVEPFDFGRQLRGGFTAVEIGALCAEETAFHRPESKLIALGDSLIVWEDELRFVPDDFMGDDPEAVKVGLRRSLEGLLDRDFETLLLAHGDPLVGEGKERLRQFVA
ncbi:MAG: hypothetical protein KY397_03650 [Gemmatimonadetes bacterium]|nr:hypothetical protein [Gemmatimonadota bacterium]